MRRWMTVGALALGGLAATGVGAVAVGRARWRRDTARAVARLDALAAARAAVIAERPATYDPAQLAGLPAPVARYLAHVLVPGQPRVRRAHVAWAGEFQMRPGAGWFPFTAEQDFTVDPPGMVWDATMEMFPLLPVRVRDAIVGGRASMLGRALAVVPVVDQAGTPELAAGALTRWLGEAVWFPTAFLPGEGVTWTAIDDSTARATVRAGDATVSADFHFAPTGEVTRFTALRYRDVNGRGVLTPFEGRTWDYGRLGGMRVPMRSEVRWLPPGEPPHAYWRGRPTGARYR